ncbi:MAG: peptide chain release factor 2 [Caldilineales bacterium]|nr:peptide chain release factor 2 [Caldilineales bacterium]
MVVETRSQLEELSTRIAELRGAFDLPGKQARLAALEKQVADPAIWDDPANAQALMRELNDLREEVAGWDGLAQRVQDALDLLALAEAEEDEATAEAIAADAEALAQELEEKEFHLALSGPHDRKGAILSIHAGAGGTEAQDWAEMLLRMYLRWAERKGYTATITDRTDGEEAGIKSVTVEIEGPWAYGYLKAERGVHRLVRISPFDASARRHTSFALVEVLPLMEDDIEVEIKPEDLRIDVYRAGSAGGQNVQKNATAVRITHIPTGIVVQCQNERSLTQNRESAMRVLRGKLYDLELQKREQELARLKGKHVEMGWGNQIRSYVLQPYQMVKDLRTDYEVGNPTRVLDGDLDGFMVAWLKAQVGSNGSNGASEG